MKLIIFDLEMNQPSGTIIEIGAVKVDLKLRKIEKTFQSFCQLETENLSHEISQLTGIQAADLENAPSLANTCTKFWEWCLEAECGRRISAWGDDLEILRQACVTNRVAVPDKLRYYDLNIFADFFRFASGASKKRGGLATTCENFHVPIENHHRALDDAKTTAKLYMQFYRHISNSLQMEKLYR